MKHIIIILTLILITSVCMAENTQDKIKILVKEVAIDIMTNTLEGADQSKIDDLYNLINITYAIELNQSNKERLFAIFVDAIKSISVCSTKKEQDEIFKTFFTQMEIFQ